MQPQNSETAMEYAKVMRAITMDVLTVDDIRTVVTRIVDDYRRNTLIFPVNWCSVHATDDRTNKTKRPTDAVSHFQCLQNRFKISLDAIVAMEPPAPTPKPASQNQHHHSIEYDPYHTLTRIVYVLHVYISVWIDEIGVSGPIKKTNADQ